MFLTHSSFTFCQNRMWMYTVHLNTSKTFVRTLKVFKGTTFFPRMLVIFIVSQIWGLGLSVFYVVAASRANSLVTNLSDIVVLPPHVFETKWLLLSSLWTHLPACFLKDKFSLSRHVRLTFYCSHSETHVKVLQCFSCLQPEDSSGCINRDTSDSDRCMFHASNCGWSMSTAAIYLAMHYKCTEDAFYRPL